MSNIPPDLVLPLALGGGRTPAQKREALRQIIDGAQAVTVPGVYDALTAVMAQGAGFPVAYLTGAGVANTQLGVPDVGLLQFDSILLQLRRIVGVTDFPIIVDADTGFGGPASTMYVTRMLEATGAAAMQIEDQEMPKRCGHFQSKSVVELGEMQAKVEAAVLARTDPNFLVIARTDALAPEGLESALRRAHGYRDAGADIIFIEAPNTTDDLTRIAESLSGVPLLINVVEGGTTPDQPTSEYEALGYRLVLRANLLMRCMVHAGLECLAALKDGTSPMPPLVSWEQRQELVRLQDFDDLEGRLRARWSTP
jgi:2-methylisocitrate lyase-like PEP mutase family enzyme